VAHVTVLKDPETLAAVAAERVTALARAATAARQRTTICLAGGQTPRRLYELVADPAHPWRSMIDWTRIHIFWGDERPVPPEHPESNFGMAYRALLAHVPIPLAHVHRMRGELAELAEAAGEYDAIVRAYEPFDLLLLGLGEDAHIASIFPGSPLLNVGAGFSRLEGIRVAAVWVDHLNAGRITLTPAALLQARTIVVLASGHNKADAVRAALDGPEDVSRWPAQLLRASGDRVEWLMDSAAAQRRGAPPA